MSLLHSPLFPIYPDSKNGYITLSGVRRWGFFTAGHVVDRKQDAVIRNISGTNIGKVIRYQNSGSIDAAFIEMTGYGSTFVKVVDNSFTIKPLTFVLPAVGSIVYMSGHVTRQSYPGPNPGSVISVVNSRNWGTAGGGVFTNLIEANYLSARGDSGGLVYVRTSSPQEAIAVGVHKGSTTGTTSRWSTRVGAISAAWDSLPS